MGNPEVAARESFAVYLETAGPGEAAERMKRRFGRAAVQAAFDRWSGRLTGPWTTAADVVALLGPPDERDDSTLRYALPTRAGYLYTFDFGSPGGRLQRSGFRRMAAVPAPRGELADLTRLPVKLAQIGATAEEVRSWLGAPAREFGWWPVDTWEYPSGLVLQLRHSVVEPPQSE